MPNWWKKKVGIFVCESGDFGLVAESRNLKSWIRTRSAAFRGAKSRDFPSLGRAARVFDALVSSDVCNDFRDIS